MQKLKTEIVNEIEQLESEINFNSKNSFDDGFKIFTELLRYLRDEKNLKLLMICRQIQKINIEKNIVSFNAEDSVIDEIINIQEFYDELKTFFERYDLSLKINSPAENISTADKLREWLGKKLIIKN